MKINRYGFLKTVLQGTFKGTNLYIIMISRNMISNQTSVMMVEIFTDRNGNVEVSYFLIILCN